MSVMLESITITLNSTINAIDECMNAIRNGGYTFVKLSPWLTAYFIIVMPPLTSFSTLICIIMEAINLAIMRSSFPDAYILKSFSVMQYIQTQYINTSYMICTISEFWNTSVLCSSTSSNVLSSLLSELLYYFKNTANPIEAESLFNFIYFNNLQSLSTVNMLYTLYFLTAISARIPPMF